jgi:hypothetical protein
MAKTRLIKDFPRIEKKLETVDDVQKYLERMARTLNEYRPLMFQGDILIGTTVPTSNDGKDGDVYIKI